MGLREDNLMLRKLARAVMQGELGREEYYRRRRHVIDGYTGDAAADADSDPTVALDAVDRTHPELPPVSEPTFPGGAMPMVDGTADNLPGRPAGQGDVWIGLVVVVIVIGVVWGLLSLFM